MLNKWLPLIMTALALSACAHHQGVRVDCEGTLRPINRPPTVSPSGGTSHTDVTPDDSNTEAPHGGR